MIDFPIFQTYSSLVKCTKLSNKQLCIKNNFNLYSYYEALCVLFLYRIIKKDQFKEMKNDHLELEPFVECQDCGRKLHQICVLHMENIWPQGWVILSKLNHLQRLLSHPDQYIQYMLLIWSMIKNLSVLNCS